MSVVQNGLEGIRLLNEHHSNPIALMSIISVAINQSQNIADAGAEHPWDSVAVLVEFINRLAQVHQLVSGGNASGASIVAGAALALIPQP